ncbi:helix-turn-helix domain-containing protein [Butyricicoccus faecihominis]|uniref:helix-turn-helix domain-containing protein n=1 Tax=Butyricicoccus faecihominis TaxID=1712515 RepID=UPI00247A5533|nr:helix-turn-helix domain-containing protein [Butyricicoccus faecihominis]MCQ5129500.1 helix-turn-helix domain-containing protein [Butyricicoccus faecihominis]
MYFTSGSDRAFEHLMTDKPGFDHYESGDAGAPEDCGTCRFYRPHWKYQFCVYAECPYQPGKLTAAATTFTVAMKGVDEKMSVFRVEKNKGYTVMSNHHLRNKELSLKAKGLLSQMLSLPEDWDYTLKGLSLINREQIDAIREAVRELERAGYIVRSRERDGKGRLRGADYIIYEQPQTPPEREKPTLENPILENPVQEKPALGNPTQLNKEEQITDQSITDVSSTHSIPILSPPSPLEDGAAQPQERNGKEAATQSAVEIYREIIKDNIEYTHLTHDSRIDRDMLDEIVDLLVETVCSARKTIRVAGDDYPAELVKSKLMKLDSGHIEFVFDCLKENTTKIRNFKKYLLAVLFNAPSTINGYYTALVAHDMATGQI